VKKTPITIILTTYVLSHHYLRNIDTSTSIIITVIITHHLLILITIDNTGSTPVIDTLFIELISQQHFGSTVPPRYHLSNEK